MHFVISKSIELARISRPLEARPVDGPPCRQIPFIGIDVAVDLAQGFTVKGPQYYLYMKD
jgi:hypothetical protein